MIDFFLSSANTPFTIALAVMVIFTLMEIISTALGMGLSEMVDSLLPEIEADIDLDVETDMADFDGPASSLTKLLAWFRVGEVPVVMLFIIFLTGFGLSGTTIQFLALSILGSPLPVVLASLISLMAAIPAVRFCGGLLGKYMPKDETYVVSEDSFLGMVATLTLGDATTGKTAQAKLRDKHGQTHYLLVEPDNPEESFKQGETVIIVRKKGSLFTIIAADHAAMTD